MCLFYDQSIDHLIPGVTQSGILNEVQNIYGSTFTVYKSEVEGISATLILCQIWPKPKYFPFSYLPLIRMIIEKTNGAPPINHRRIDSYLPTYLAASDFKYY